MPREAARSAGPRLRPCIRGLAPQIASTLVTPLRGLEQSVQEDRLADAIPGFEQRDVLIDEVDVPRPSTLGIMITSTLLPTCLMISVMSSSTHGLFRALIRTHMPVSPKSCPLSSSMKPARAASLASMGMASSRLPHMTSHLVAVSGALLRIFSMCGGKKWIILSGRTGSSRSGCGAPMASGL